MEKRIMDQFNKCMRGETTMSDNDVKDFKAQLKEDLLAGRYPLFADGGREIIGMSEPSQYPKSTARLLKDFDEKIDSVFDSV